MGGKQEKVKQFQADAFFCVCVFLVLILVLLLLLQRVWD